MRDAQNWCCVIACLVVGIAIEYLLTANIVERTSVVTSSLRTAFLLWIYNFKFQYKGARK